MVVNTFQEDLEALNIQNMRWKKKKVNNSINKNILQSIENPEFDFLVSGIGHLIS